MIRPIETYKGDYFFMNDLLLYVNRATEDFNVPLHDHDFFEFTYIVEGHGFHHVGDEVHPVRKGQLFFIPIGTSHVFRPASVDSSQHSLIVNNCVFSPALLAKLENFVSDPKVKAYIASIREGKETYFYFPDADDAIEKLFLSLHREYSLPRDGSTDYLYALFLQLLVAVFRMTQQPASPSARKLTDFDHLLTYVEQNLANELSLSHLARISRWSERHLQRLFKQHTAQSFNHFVQTLRIRKSCELLRDTPLKIGAIAETVGYRDMASFLGVFKRKTGTTPSAYRKGAVPVSQTG